ncbi:MAG: acetyl-CoA carboxylase carboxyl transferase subunit alpha, partial [Methylobacterium sp.]
MKITAQDLLRLGIIDGIIPEATGGAHRDRDAAIADTGAAIATALAAFDGLGPDEIRDRRAQKFLEIGRKL